MKMEASGGRRKYNREGWKKGPKRRLWSEKANGRIKKGKDISPSDVRSRVRGSSRVEKDTITEINDAIGRGREVMPKEPPSTGWVRKGGVIGVFADEVTVVTAASRVNRQGKQGHKGIEEG